MATYVIGDIHNSLKKFVEMIKLISPTMQDQIILLGDIFDRGGAEPDPVGVYFRICWLNTNVKLIRGNHDHHLAKYIHTYYGTVPKRRSSLQPYRYNSFDLMKDRFTEVDMLNLADQIMALPLQIEINIGAVKYLLAHAMTFDPMYGEQEETMYLEGIAEMQKYWQYGIKGYVSLIGHRDSGYQYNNPYGSYLDDKLNSIWVNEPENVYMVDCGCGLPNGRLACICLETRERFCAEITGLSYNSIDFLFNRKLSDIEIETLLGECENIHADVACSGGYEEMRKIIKEKSELHIWWD